MTLPALPSALSARIDQHLRTCYEGIFTPAAIEAHLKEYVGGTEAAYFWDSLQVVLKGGERILDVGSGYGAFVLTARQKGFDASGLEIESFDIACARERLTIQEPQAQAENVFVQGSALSLPFPDESFDVVTFWNVIEHLPDYRQALSEAVRVLKRGGWIAIEAPNYAAFRQEAHYHVPWLPWFPRPLAATYLRMLGRDPVFLQENIFYCSLWGTISCLKRQGCLVSSIVHEKLLRPENIGRPALRHLVTFIIRCRMAPVLGFLLSARMFFPLRASIQCLGRKP